jgi:arylmalonate decarboxylase
MSIVSPWLTLGYVIPHLYTDMDAYQFYRVAPDGMMLVTTGLNLKEYSLASVETELPALWKAFDLLKEKNVDRISLSGVPVASVLGRRKMCEILDEGAQRTGIPCDTDLEAHIATLQHFGVTRLALATRWPDNVNNALTAYLQEAGIEVVVCRARGRSLDQNKVSSPLADHELALELGRAALAAAPEAQALLLPGGLWFAIHAVPILEAEFGKPVLLNITSTTRTALAAASQPLKVRPDVKWGKVMASC